MNLDPNIETKPFSDDNNKYPLVNHLQNASSGNESIEPYRPLKSNNYGSTLIHNNANVESETSKPDNDCENDQMPLLRRSKTFGENAESTVRPVSAPVFNMSNFSNSERRFSIFPVTENQNLSERVNSLKQMRPFRLIGPISKLSEWSNFKMDGNDIDKMKNNRLKRFYQNQNEMIERYEDIDLLLETGVQIEMIQNYGDNTSSDASSDSEIEEPDFAQPVNNLNATEMEHADSSNTTDSTLTVNRKRKLADIRSTPGNIDLEGARILGQPQSAESNIVLYAIYFNFSLNVMLLLGKVFAVYLSDSLSLMASLVDSALDFLSTLIIFIANKYAIKKTYRFPVGRRQLEPIGVLIFSIIVILSFAQVLIESVKQLTNGSPDDDVANLSRVAVGIMIGTILTKLAAYLLCKNVNNSSVRALVEDAKTDIIFNFFSLVFPIFGFFSQIWWLDPLGATLLCLYVILQWILVTFEHIDHLSGSHASSENYHQVLYLIFRFTTAISKIKNFRMYHIGDLVNVEVDIVLRNQKLSLKDCHDIGESLQYAIETLPYVNRCFVHIDYKVRNYMGHLS